jgi:hypothetical protein
MTDDLGTQIIETVNQGRSGYERHGVRPTSRAHPVVVNQSAGNGFCDYHLRLTTSAG